MSYARNCSCCGGHIDKEQVDFLKSQGEYDSEGNHCASCYDDIAKDNLFQYMEMFDMVYDALKSPISKFKFKYSPLENRVRIVNYFIDKGFITWSIG